MKRLALLSAFILATLLTYSQKQANYWHFGVYAGLDFSGGDPVALTNSQLETGEGCSSISDLNGNLMFYTDGRSVWNRNNVLMPHGQDLFGHSSSTQSGIIVPVSHNSPVYYIFTIDAVDSWPNGNGMCYTKVNMDLEGGLGDVVETSKNTLVMDDHCEKVTAVGNWTGDGTWILVQKYGTNEFHAFLMDAFGVAPAEVSHAGATITTGQIDNAKGYIKVSPNGEKFAVAHVGLHMIQIGNFNTQTGMVSNVFQDYDFGTKEPYGIEFSPDGRYLYVSTWKSDANGGGLFQYDLLAGSNQQILESRVLISEDVDGALQIGPNNRIYAANNNDTRIGVIRKPNETGTACNYMPNSVHLAGRTCRMGLPPFVQSFFNQEASFSYDAPCFTIPTQFYETCAFEPDSILWNFGDPASGDENISRLMNPTHLFTSDDFFTVKMTAYSGLDSVTVTRIINVNLIPDVNLGSDTSFCQGDTFLIDAGEGYDQYMWQNGYSTQTLATDTAGLFWVEVTNVGCSNKDSILLETKPTYHFDSLTSICFGETIQIGGQTVSEAGTYYDSLNSMFGCDSVYQIELMVHDTALTERYFEICSGDSVFAGGEWQTESGTWFDYFETYLGCDSTIITEVEVTDVIHSFSEAEICDGDSLLVGGGWQQSEGMYYDTAVSVGGCDSIHTTYLLVHDNYSSTTDTIICEGESVYAGGEWQTEAGTYLDNLQTMHGCDSLITTNIDVLPQPQVDLGNDTLLPEEAELLLVATFPEATYLWHDGSTDSTFLVTEEGVYYVGVTVTCGTAWDTIKVDYIEPEIPVCTPQSPNAFSPNGDGLNDVFNVVSECQFASYHLQIYDRWGKLIFETTEIDEGWDGKSNGEMVPIGSYIWRLQYSELSREDLLNSLHGTLMLVK